MRTLQNELIDRSRYESEGSGIDFKREQYLFLSGNEEKSSELLKDVLAMANAWRRGDKGVPEADSLEMPQRHGIGLRT